MPATPARVRRRRLASAAVGLALASLAAATACDPESPPKGGSSSAPAPSGSARPTATGTSGGGTTVPTGGPSSPAGTTAPATPPASTPAPGTPPAASGPLPFDMPGTAALRSSPKKVFAHYFTPYPISLNNAQGADDYYTKHYLNPAGENGKHQPYGGLLRDRPVPRAPLPGDWELQDMETEVRTAVSAGIDGFTVDLLNLAPGTPHRKRVELLVKAAERVDPGFRIVLMPDMTATQVKGLDPAGLAAALAGLAGSKSVQTLGDGRLVVSPFKAEERPAQWWRDFMAAMEANHGKKVALVPVFLNLGANADAFAPISHGFSVWGNRSPKAQAGIAGDAAKAHGLGKIWMQPVSVQDERPNQGIFDEAGNTENLRATWQGAIDKGADWVQLTTWNDYSEGTQFAPSVHNGRVYLDISAYYLTWFKTGKQPAVVRDVIYLTHRKQFAATRPGAAGQTKFMAPRGGSTPPRDTAEVLAFLTAPAAIRAQSGTQVRDVQAPAGPSAHLVPLGYGAQTATATRGTAAVATVTSPFPLTQNTSIQDLQYVAAGSARP
ncbi:glycoside hydrolase family 71 protein [Yinghuangia soli]|uniref:Glycoside hydrolase family 71 protein n=1 Tax=Yinghuangia soli TaxID=2908204 RepID=A0AA41Q2Y6_9ACTN|nr:glycoside hydrolase family 71 protein [Yinghuangia soli]MCF2530584.1 glycoside hydrolase family 71 protein [Yinghuangia soli]